MPKRSIQDSLQQPFACGSRASAGITQPSSSSPQNDGTPSGGRPTEFRLTVPDRLLLQRPEPTELPGETEQDVRSLLRDQHTSQVTTQPRRTPVMDAEPLAALDLPPKLLVWDDRGQTHMSYLTPAVLAGRYAMSESLAAPLAGTDRLADAALADPPASADAASK